MKEAYCKEMEQIPLNKTVFANPKFETTKQIAIVGKYFSNPKAFQPILDSLRTASFVQKVNFEVHIVNSFDVTQENAKRKLQ